MYTSALRCLSYQCSVREDGCRLNSDGSFKLTVSYLHAYWCESKLDRAVPLRRAARGGRQQNRERQNKHWRGRNGKQAAHAEDIINAFASRNSSRIRTRA